MAESRDILQTHGLAEDFDKIYVMYYPRMLRFSKEFSLCDEDAENIVQDIFASLWEKRSGLAVQTSLSFYLFSLVKNRCIDYLRHKAAEAKFKREYALKLQALERLNEQFSTDVDVEALVRRAIGKLPERCRAVFLKSRLEGKKYREIAAELGMAESTVESQMSIALKKLRSELREYLPLILFFC